MIVRVVPYDPGWKKAYEQEAQLIQNILEDLLIEIHHIGSTSVEGLAAKPIIDIMPVVKDITLVDQFNFKLESIGYECMGEFGMPGRRYFRKGGSHRTHHIHIFEETNQKDIIRHLAVRDFLRNDPQAKEAYAALKQRLAGLYAQDIEAYMDGKDLFVKQLEADALLWYNKLNKQM